jgi:hypothetical protein
MSAQVKAMQHWVNTVIVKYNFCPFARKEVEENRIHYSISKSTTHDDAVMDMLEQCSQLKSDPARETTLLMFPDGFKLFDDFIDLIDLANTMLRIQGYEGEFQIATFHPEYVFAGCDDHDPANYTNRAPYPTLHLIREASMSVALDNYDDPDSIPENNIKLAHRKGEAFWQQLLSNCFKNE